MSARRIVAIAAAGAVALGGAGVAIGAVSKDDPKKSEDAVLADAAKRLDVPPAKLRDALKAAQDAQLDTKLDEAVKAGDLTSKQADAIKKAHDQSPTVLGPGFGGGPGGPGFRGRGGPGPGGPGDRPHFPGPGGPRMGLFDDLAKALGITDRELFAQLRQGKGIAAIAKAEGKSLADVRSAVKAAAKTRADKAVQAGDLTRKQADELLAHLDDHLSHIDRLPRHRLRGRDGGVPPAPNAKPGSFAPEQPTPVVPPEALTR